MQTRPHRFRCLRRHVPRRRPCAAGRHDDAAAHVVDLHAGGAELPAFHSAAAYTQRCQAQHLGRRTHAAEQAGAAVQMNTEKHEMWSYRACGHDMWAQSGHQVLQRLLNLVLFIRYHPVLCIPSAASCVARICAHRVHQHSSNRYASRSKLEPSTLLRQLSNMILRHTARATHMHPYPP